MPREVKRTRAGKTHTVINRGKTMTPILNKGYPRVTLRIDGKTVYRFCHQLVMEAFVGPPPPKKEVCHKDGVRTNARLDNLKYDPRWINIQAAKDHGTFKNGRSHLTKVMVHQIHFRRDDPAKMLAEAFGVRRATIYAIRNGAYWRHVTGLQPRRAAA
jgi:hypothetical protein